MRREHNIGRFQQCLIQRRFILIDIETGGSNAMPGERCGERGIVNNAAASDIDQRRRGLHQGEFALTDDVVSRRRIGQHQQQMVGLRQQLIKRYTGSPERCRTRRLAAIAINDSHRKACSAPCNRRSDPTHAEDAKGAAMDIGTQKLIPGPAIPVAGAQPALGHADAPRSSHQQRPAHIGGRFGQDIGRIGDQHAAGAAGIQVDVVIADRTGRDHHQCRTGVEQGGIDAIARHDIERTTHAGTTAKFLRRPGVISEVVVDIENRRQRLDDLGKDFSGDQQLRFHDTDPVPGGASPTMTIWTR